MGRVKTCRACGNRDASVSYHLIPKEENRRHLWIQNSGIHSPIQLQEEVRICSLHFEPDCFVHKAGAKRRRLRKNVIPSIVIDTLGPESRYIDDEEMTNNSAHCDEVFNSSSVDVNVKIEPFPITPTTNDQTDEVFDYSSVVDENIKIETLPIIPTINDQTDEVFNYSSIVDENIKTESFPITPTTDDHPDEVFNCSSIVDENIKTESLPITPTTNDHPVDANVSLETSPITSTTNNQTNGVFVYQVSSPISDSLYPEVLVTPTTHRNDDESDESDESSQYPMRKLRYIGDIRSPDLATPQRAKRCLDMAKAVILKQRKTIKSLRRKLLIEQRKNSSLKDRIQPRKSQLYVVKMRRIV